MDLSVKNVPAGNLTTVGEVICDRTPAPVREVWPDLLRLVSILAVIVVHSSYLGVAFLFPKYSFSWYCCDFYLEACRFCVPVFVMISGMFLLNPGKEYSIRKIFSHNILRIATAFLVWSAFYTLVYIFIDHHGSHRFTVCEILSRLKYGNFHLWYLPMLIGLYLITPFLRMIVQKKEVVEYFLILSFLFVFCGNAVYSTPWGKIFYHDFIKPFDLHLVLGYSGVFVLGYYLSVTKIPSWFRKTIYVAGICAIVNSVFFERYWLNLIQYQEKFDVIKQYLHLDVLCPSVAVFVFFQYNFPEIHFSARTTSMITKAGKLTFGIYLIHLFILEHLTVLGLDCSFLHPIVSIPIMTAVTFLLSYPVVFLLHKIPYVNKFVM